VAVHLIDFRRITVYEAGASLISVLAYPGDREEELRASAHASLCHNALRVLCAIEPDWALSPQPIKPIYALRTLRELKQDLRTLQRRLRDRMAAGRMAIGLLQAAVASPATGHQARRPRLSINQMARLVIDDTGEQIPKNVETRIWRASLPVIHIAAAVQRYLQLSGRDMPEETFLLNRGESV